MSDKQLAIVAGAGPGLGEALMRRLDDGGYQTVGISRTERDNDAGLDIRTADLTSPKAVNALVQDLVGAHGPPAIVIHNPAKLIISPFLETELAGFEDIWRSMALSAAILAKSVLPPMMQNGGGAFIVSGATASLRGGAKFTAFASAKFALRGLTQALAREFQPAGIHVAHVILDGIIDTKASRALHGLDPARMMAPADIAEAYWQLAHQPRSTWTHELDLRPASETF